jgi:hypothetical protein
LLADYLTSLAGLLGKLVYVRGCHDVNHRIFRMVCRNIDGGVQAWIERDQWSRCRAHQDAFFKIPEFQWPLRAMIAQPAKLGSHDIKVLVDQKPYSSSQFRQ